jgi:hypothetical protein
MGFINRFFGKPELKYYVAKFEEDHIRDEDLYELVRMSKESLQNIKELYSQILKSEEKLLIEYRDDEKLIIELFKKLDLKKENSNLLMSEIDKLEKNSKTCSADLKEVLNKFKNLFYGAYHTSKNKEEMEHLKKIFPNQTAGEIHIMCDYIKKIKNEFDEFNLENKFSQIEEDIKKINLIFKSNLISFKKIYLYDESNLIKQILNISKTYREEIKFHKDLSENFNKIIRCLGLEFYTPPFYNFANKRINALVFEKKKLLVFLTTLKERIKDVLDKAESLEKKFEQKQMAFNHN